MVELKREYSVVVKTELSALGKIKWLISALKNRQKGWFLK